MSRPSRNIIHLFNCLNVVLPSSPFFAFRRRLLRACGVVVGEGVRVNTQTSFFWHNVAIGKGTWIGPACSFHSTAEAAIRLGANCDVAPGVRFVTGTHEIGGSERRAGRGKSLPITVGDGCWVGTAAVILGGANIGNGTVVAAGALVLAGDYPSDSLLAGVPARVKRTLASDSYEQTQGMIANGTQVVKPQPIQYERR